ncbi:uncharacterized protein [Gossypium hirsutum]|uniref:Uncharacterized protein isoform X18 n=1 Tax=Gossypium hirsutum TaxID=3635 RepID=A0A1U8JUX6_GOSHI|nr:uncharacterized protein LOC107909094 isoform X18 [Gossypium hirsutum]
MLVLLPWLSLTHAHSDTSAVSLPYRFIRLCTTGPGSHKLFHILTNAPLPTFHLMPCFSNFWALQILRQIIRSLIGWNRVGARSHYPIIILVDFDYRKLNRVGS